jgi:hypothetical protein
MRPSLATGGGAAPLGRKQGLRRHPPVARGFNRISRDSSSARPSGNPSGRHCRMLPCLVTRSRTGREKISLIAMFAAFVSKVLSSSRAGARCFWLGRCWRQPNCLGLLGTPGARAPFLVEAWAGRRVPESRLLFRPSDPVQHSTRKQPQALSLACARMCTSVQVSVGLSSPLSQVMPISEHDGAIPRGLCRW